MFVPPRKSFLSPISVRPPVKSDVRGVKQLDRGIGYTFALSVREEVAFALIDFHN
jgi:hypothetical protein